MSSRTIGVDVGGTKIAVAVMDGMTMGKVRLLPTLRDSTEVLVDQLVEMIEAAGPADAVGVAVPSIIDFATGCVLSSVNIPLADVPLRQVLQERVGMPVYVENDAACAGLAEAYGEDGTLLARHLVMFTIGTGVGGAIVLDGRIYRGATGAAAEFGHTIVGADFSSGEFPTSKRFPQPGSLESLGSGRALNRILDDPNLDGHVIDAQRAGNTDALAAIQLLGARLGIAIANAINTFDPDLILIGGGISIAGEVLLTPARDVAARFTVPGAGSKTRILRARYGPGAGVRGAALLAAHELAAESVRQTAERPER
jgi:glucokinase